MDAFVIKMNGALYPASEHDRELLGKFKTGEPTRVTLRRVRNYEFHKKFFKLLDLAFDYWIPPENVLGEKNFDRFRYDITILAGFYEQTVRLNGEIRTEAKSISFDNMSEDEFEDLYLKTIDVIIKHVLKNYSGDMLRSIVDQVQEFE